MAEEKQALVNTAASTLVEHCWCFAWLHAAINHASHLISSQLVMPQLRYIASLRCYTQRCAAALLHPSWQAVLRAHGCILLLLVKLLFIPQCLIYNPFCNTSLPVLAQRHIHKKLPPRPPAPSQSLGRVMGISQSVQNNIVNLSDGVNHRVCYAAAHTLVVLDTITRTQKFLQGHRSSITCIASTYDHSIVASADSGADSMIVFWNAATGAPIRILNSPHASGVCAMEISQVSMLHAFRCRFARNLACAAAIAPRCRLFS